MKVKTSELIGLALDWAVAKCEGVRLTQRIDSFKAYGAVVLQKGGVYSPSTNWSQGGPITQNKKIDTKLIDDSIPELWGAQLSDPFGARRRNSESLHYSIGPTALIAAMRCYVASKMGEETDIPDELT